MTTQTLARLYGHIPRLQRIGLAALPIVGFSTSALAQTVTGAIDPTTGLANLAPYFLGLVASALVIVCTYKGVHAAMEGRSFGGHIAALVCGLGLAFGGYYVLSKYGVATAA